MITKTIKNNAHVKSSENWIQHSLDKKKRWELPEKIHIQIRSDHAKSKADENNLPSASKRKNSAKIRRTKKRKNASTPNELSRTVLLEKLGDWLTPMGNNTRRMVDSKDGIAKRSKNWYVANSCFLL